MGVMTRAQFVRLVMRTEKPRRTFSLSCKPLELGEMGVRDKLGRSAGRKQFVSREK